MGKSKSKKKIKIDKQKLKDLFKKNIEIMQSNEKIF